MSDWRTGSRYDGPQSGEALFHVRIVLPDGSMKIRPVLIFTGDGRGAIKIWFFTTVPITSGDGLASSGSFRVWFRQTGTCLESLVRVPNGTDSYGT
jgi:hypothetical protein